MTNRSDHYTIKTKQVEVYSDFHMNMELNPITGFLARVTNEESIKQSLKCLVLTQRTERFYNKYIGTRLRALMFEPMDSVTEDSIRNEILETISNNEPRVEDVNVDVKGDESKNSYNIIIYYSIINIPQQTYSLNLILKRVR
jgi:phage baseplate assembly protein W